MSVKYKLVIARHGESSWSEQHLYGGWFDCDISEMGKESAAMAGRALKKEGFAFDIGYSSVLRRASNTLKIILKEMDLPNVVVVKHWRLNDRHFGGLTGLSRDEIVAKYGLAQLLYWRRGFASCLPGMSEHHLYYDTLVRDPRYAVEPTPEEFSFSKGESYKDGIDRTLKYWTDVIEPQIKEGKNVLIVAHINSLRGIIKHLENLSEITTMNLNLPFAIPMVYELDEQMQPINSYFLGNEENVKRAMAASHTL